MPKCTIIGKIRVQSNVGQAVRINGKKCKEETLWDIPDAYGGESYVTDFTVENKSNKIVSIEWDISSPTDSEYTVGIYENDGVTPVSSPTSLVGKETKNWKLKIEFDQYIEDDTYEITVEFDYA